MAGQFLFGTRTIIDGLGVKIAPGKVTSIVVPTASASVGDETALLADAVAALTGTVVPEFEPADEVWETPTFSTSGAKVQTTFPHIWVMGHSRAGWVIIVQ